MLPRRWLHLLLVQLHFLLTLSFPLIYLDAGLLMYSVFDIMQIILIPDESWTIVGCMLIIEAIT